MLAAALLKTGASAQTRYLDNVFTNVKVTSDIQYGSNAYTYNSGDTKTLLLDIYEPMGDVATSRPVIIICHEGGFLNGTKTDNECVDFANRMAKKGYVVASINYRLGWGFGATNTQEQNAREIVPALWRAMQDGKAAVRFFRKSAATGNPYKIDVNNIISGGFGAGAFIPVQNEYFDSPAEFNYDKVSKKDANGVPLSPRQPYIDTTNVNTGGFQGNGTNGSSNPGFSWRSSAVLNFCGALGDTAFLTIQTTNKSVPIISCHGDADDITPIGTDIVRAAGTFDVLEVSGSYDVARVLNRANINTILNGITDNLPNPDTRFADANGNASKVREKVKDKGTYVFRGENYQPYDASPSTTVSAVIGTDVNSSAVAATYMDTLVTFTCTRLYKVMNSSTGIDVSYGSKLRTVLVSPNPSNGEFKIDLRDFTASTFELKIYDLMGKEVYSAAQLPTTGYTMPAGVLAEGHYIAHIVADKETVLAKITIVK